MIKPLPHVQMDLKIRTLFSERPRSDPFRRSQGFSLLEALVAMAIASIALGTLYRGVGQSAKVATEVEWRADAAIAASAVLTSETFAEDLMKKGSGQMGRWFWQAHIVPEFVQLHDSKGRSVGEPLRAGKVTVSISSVQGGRPVFTVVSWKPYRVAV